MYILKKLLRQQRKIEQTELSFVSGQPLQARCFWAVGMALVFAGFAAVFSTTAALAAEPQGLPCGACHKQVLEYHDALGSGDRACWVCHDTADMKSLRLRDGTLVPRSETPEVCGQCHQRRYEAWKDGTHGVKSGVTRIKCSECHDPHKPQIALLDITKPHPAPAPPPPAPPADILMITGISVLFLTGVGVVVSRNGGKR